jgi:hypothetical protein
MLELNALSFMSATTELSNMNQLVRSKNELASDPLLASSITAVKPMLERFSVEAANVGAKFANISADRLYRLLNTDPCPLTWGQLGTLLSDIESRFADHLRFVKLFVIHDEKLNFFDAGSVLLGEPTASRFPSVLFDVEEASRCLCLARPTACVFHCMRMIEIGVRSLAKKLAIPDPTKPAERNWGVILSAIKAAIDSRYPTSRRMHGSEGAFLEETYVTLDAIKNPWRNATMHVDTVYTEAEAFHILNCSAIFVRKIANVINESGEDV